FSLLAPTKWHIAKRNHQQDALAQGMLDSLTTGFHALIREGYSNLDDIVDTADRTAVFTADFDQLLRTYDLPRDQQALHTPNMALLRYMRWCVMHDILSLPAYGSDDGVVPEPEPEHIVYELCRN